jgi:hypothetical protein
MLTRSSRLPGRSGDGVFLERFEPCEGKLSGTVLRGRGRVNRLRLPGFALHAMHIQRFIFTATLAMVVSGCLDRIPPTALTETRMFVTKRRILQYARAQNQLPTDLISLPPMSGYDTSVTDGWGRRLSYQTNSTGIVTLQSLGRDGVAGGSGDDADIVHSFPARDTQGTWSDELVDWSKSP